MLRWASAWKEILIGAECFGLAIGSVDKLMESWRCGFLLWTQVDPVLKLLCFIFYYLFGLNESLVCACTGLQIYTKAFYCGDILTQHRTSLVFLSIWFRPGVDSIIQKWQKEQDNWEGSIFLVLWEWWMKFFFFFSSFAMYQILSLLAVIWSGLPWRMPKRYLISPATVS